MTKVVVRNPFPVIDRDSFLTPFDKMFDELVSKTFPQINEQVGVNPFQGTAYPKVNVYEYDDKIGIVAEIPGLKKDQLNIEVEDGVLTVESKDSKDDNDKEYVHQGIAKRSFKKSWTLSDDIEVKHADLIDGMLTIELEKIFPEGKEPREIPIGAFKE